VVEGKPLADDCLVIRGGLMELTTLKNSLAACIVQRGFFGLSLWGENGLSVGEVCDAARLRNLRVRVSTVGRLRALGMEPFRSGRPPHLSLRFDTAPLDEDLERLADAFGPPVGNPRRAD
jgi:hypothetical protein